MPELPLPGPLPTPGASSGSNVLFHPRVAEEAKQILHVQDPNLALRLAQALSSTTEYNLDVTDSSSPGYPGPGQFPLVQQVVAQNPGGLSFLVAGQGQGWGHGQAHDQGSLQYGGGGGWDQHNHRVQNRANGHGGHSSGSHPQCTIIMLVTSNSTICSSNTTVNNHRCLSSHNLSRKITRFLGIRENRNNRLPRSPRISHCMSTKDCRRRIML